MHDWSWWGHISYFFFSLLGGRRVKKYIGKNFFFVTLKTTCVPFLRQPQSELYFLRQLIFRLLRMDIEYSLLCVFCVTRASLLFASGGVVFLRKIESSVLCCLNIKTINQMAEAWETLNPIKRCWTKNVKTSLGSVHVRYYTGDKSQSRRGIQGLFTETDSYVKCLFPRCNEQATLKMNVENRTIRGPKSSDITCCWLSNKIGF